MLNPKSAVTAEVSKALADLPAQVRTVAAVACAQNRAIGYADLALWSDDLGWSLQDAMRALLPLAAASSHSPISKFKVGAVAACTKGTEPDEVSLYLGANLEFLGGTLADSVHAEQTAVVRAWLDGASSLALVATDAAPCGHCRQFLTEVRSGAEGVVLLMPHGPVGLVDSIPDAFGPETLGAAHRVFDVARVDLALAQSDQAIDLAASALEAARQSYVPYSGCPAGAALRLASGRVVEGRALESVAFNPSLSPIQCALAQLDGPSLRSDPVVAGCLVEAVGSVSHASRDRRLLGLIAPGVELQVLKQPQ